MNELAPSALQSERLLYPEGVGVDPNCAGELSECMFRNGEWFTPELPCGQRCLFGPRKPGTKEWYRELIARVRQAHGPVYLMGVDADHAGGAKERFEKLRIAYRSDLVHHVLPLPHGQTPDEILSKGARRDARIGDRAGLSFEVAEQQEAFDTFYELYSENCRRQGSIPLSPDFIGGEFLRNPSGFRLLFARLEGEVIGGRLVVLQANVLKVIEGSSLRKHAAAQPDAWLNRELIRFALEHEVNFIDYGICETENTGLRAFKKRMGFVESARVVGLESMTRKGEGEPPARPQFAPGRVDVALLEQCNFACGFCYREPWVPELSLAEVERRIQGVAQLTHSGIAFSGGEPTLRKDLVDIIQRARVAGISDIQLHTNGWKAADWNYAVELRKAGLSSAMVSLHSQHAPKFGAITRTKEAYFDRTLVAIDNLRNAGVYVLLSHVINAMNWMDWADYVRFVADRFPGAEIFLFFVYPSVKGAGHPDLYPRLESVRTGWLEGLDVAEELGVKVTVDSLAGLPLCFMGRHASASRWSYAVAQERETGGEVDDHQVKAPEMRQGSGCRSCMHGDWCPGFWSEYLDQFGEDELVPVLPS